MIALLLAAQLLALPKPCPPSIACTLPPDVVRATRWAPPVTTLADPERPAKWFITAAAIEVAVFETVALTTHHDTISQLTQDEAREHHAIRWLGVAAMGALTWHLFWGFP